MNIGQVCNSQYAAIGYLTYYRRTDNQALSEINKNSLEFNRIRVASSSSFQAQAIDDLKSTNSIGENVFRIIRLNSQYCLPYDLVVNEVWSHFADEKELLMLLQVRLKELMEDFSAKNKPSVDGNELLRNLKALPNTPEGFLQLDTVLRPSRFSLEELREEAYLEKYGI